MDCKTIMMCLTAMLILCCTSVSALKARSVIAAPAPAPAPDYVNLTHLLTYTGPFQTFLNYLESTKVLDTFQNGANNTKDGITIFVPKDEAFSSLKKPSLANLTNDQLRSVLLFHGLPRFYTLSDFKNLNGSPVTTLAGGQYTLNFTDVSGTVIVNSGWSNTTISSAVHSSYPASVFQVDKVLLPEAIYGTDIPPPPPPSPVAPSPKTTPAADAPAGSASSKNSPPSPKSSASQRSSRLGFLGCIVSVCGGVLFLSL
nr:fasciclin-like arabinogalactan protein 5 [Centaurium erythraea]